MKALLFTQLVNSVFLNRCAAEFFYCAPGVQEIVLCSKPHVLTSSNKSLLKKKSV